MSENDLERLERVLGKYPLAERDHRHLAVIGLLSFVHLRQHRPPIVPLREAGPGAPRHKAKFEVLVVTDRL